MTDLAAYRAACAAKKPSALADGLTKIPALNPTLFPHQAHGVEFALRAGRAATFYDTGLGKQQPLSEPVLTPEGWRTIGDLKAGDFVIGSDGQPTEVLRVFPQGVKPVYRLELQDGTFVRAGAEHLWSVRTKVHRYRGEGFKVKTTAEIAASIHRDWQLPLITPVASPDIELPIDPYALGVMLGDGSLDATVTICTDDWIGEALRWRKVKNHETCTYVGYWTAPPEISQAIAAVGLRGARSAEKFIPPEYMTASMAQRAWLLAGLMDTDGYAMLDGGAEFSSCSRALIDGVIELVQSLGGVARGLREACGRFSYNGEVRQGQQAWRVNVRLPAGIPMFRLPRKALVYREPEKYPPTRIIRRVVDEGVSEPQACILVAAIDSLYVTRSYILTHNTRLMLDYGRCVVEATNKPVLMLAPLAVSAQHLREAEAMGVDAAISRFGQPPSSPRIVVTNYERLERFDPAEYAGVILDESSILKSFTGVTTRKLIDTFKETRFRLAGSATPAPNDHTELGQHSAFLGVMPQSEMLIRWFLHDTADTGTWRLKKHAATNFWDWVASWARCVSKPSDLGFSDEGFDLPALNVIRHVVAADRSIDSGEEKDGQGRLFRIPERSATAIHREKRLTATPRAQQVADIVSEAGRWAPICIWVDTDYEAEAVREAVPEAVEVHGRMKPDQKEELLDGFSSGQTRIILTKPSIAGYGLNWQHCHTTIFCGLSFSYESFYQAVRRFWRFGQKNAVDAHVVIADTEAEIVAAVQRKSGDHDRMKTEMTAAMARAVREHQILETYDPKLSAALPAWLTGERA